MKNNNLLFTAFLLILINYLTSPLLGMVRWHDYNGRRVLVTIPKRDEIPADILNPDEIQSLLNPDDEVDTPIVENIFCDDEETILPQNTQKSPSIDRKNKRPKRKHDSEELFPAKKRPS